MNWFYNWLRNRALKIPSDRDSGGDWLRLYQTPIFAMLDRVALRWSDTIPPTYVLTNDIVKNMPVPDVIRIMLQLFLVRVIDDAIAHAGGDIVAVVEYLKEQIRTTP